MHALPSLVVHAKGWSLFLFDGVIGFSRKHVVLESGYIFSGKKTSILPTFSVFDLSHDYCLLISFQEYT